MKPQPSHIHSVVPVISTDDIRSSIFYYTTVLGFLPDFEFGDPVEYAGVKSGETEIYFTHDPELSKLIKRSRNSPEVFIWTGDVEALFKLHSANGAKIVEPILDRGWGARRYIIKDINGYHLKFAQPT